MTLGIHDVLWGKAFGRYEFLEAGGTGEIAFQSVHSGDKREGPQWYVISAHYFALDTAAYGNRPVAGSNQEQYSLPRGLEYLPLSGSAHSSREAESEEKDIEASVIKHLPLRGAKPGEVMNLGPCLDGH